jgi:1-acyl-sn-glycerol-3-phosphate acyltransferase
MTILYRMGWIVVRSLSWLLFGFKPVGIDHVPADGPVIIASNHQSYLDPPLIGAGIRRPCHFFAKRELFDVPVLGPLISRLNAIPVRRGIYDPASLSRVREVLAAGGALVLFPEGTRNDGVEFLPPKPGVGMIARQTRATILPAYVCGTKNLWRALRSRKIRIYYGDPVGPEEIERFPDTKEGYRELAKYVMEHIGRLRVVSNEGSLRETSSDT